jgi:hypothetical protein
MSRRCVLEVALARLLKDAPTMSAWRRVWSWEVMWAMVLGLMVVRAAPGAASQADAARLRIKNGHHLTVTLGKTRQPAFGIRPEKKVWRVELGADLIGAEADVKDVTPNGLGDRWSLPVEAAELVLDPTRFLPSHVYRLEIRRERLLLGSAFVYLYPPPVERVSRLELEERAGRPEPVERPSSLGVIPKGHL